MTDWIEHNGGPQPVDDETWVDRFDRGYGLAGNPKWHWSKPVFYRILNQHLIDAKQAEIDALRDDLETWQSVFPHVMPDRLKSDQQLADEDVAAKIDAARLEGIRLGLEAAEKYNRRAFDFIVDALRNTNPETIAREAVLDQLTSEAQEQGMGYDKEADQ